MRHIEDGEQAALFEWAARFSDKYLELGMMFAIPNGGFRLKTEAARLKEMGVKSGVPDIFLPIPGNHPSQPSRHLHGMFIEMKAPKGRTSEAQDKMIPLLRACGYHVVVAYGWQQAAQEIEKYLGIKTGLQWEIK